jgi:hypothetical protein
VVKSRATGEPGLGGTVNISELLINVVRFKRAGRRQLGLGPNGTEKVALVAARSTRTVILPAERQDLILPVILAEHGKPVPSPAMRAGQP